MYNNPFKRLCKNLIPPCYVGYYRSTSPNTCNYRVSKPIVFAYQQEATDQIHRPNDRHRIRQKMPPADLIKAPEMRKPRRPNLTSIRSFTAITHDKDTHLSLWCFDRAISLSWRDGIPFREEQEVVDQSFHVFFHCCSWRRGDLVVFDSDGARWHLVEALVDDAEGLAELFHAAEVAIVAIPVHSDWDVKLYLIVRIIWLALAYVPRYTAASKHDAGERVIESVGGRDDTNTLGPAFPDSVIRKQFFCFIDPVPELSRPLVDVVEEAEWEILVDAAGADVGRVKTGAGDAFVEFLSFS